MWWRAEDMQKGDAGRARWRGQELCRMKAVDGPRKALVLCS